METFGLESKVLIQPIIKQFQHFVEFHFIEESLKEKGLTYGRSAALKYMLF